MHKLVHATNVKTIKRILIENSKTIMDLKRLNKLRKLVGNSEISVNK